MTGASQASAGIEGKRRELEGVRRTLSGLIDAIADGRRAPGLQGKLDELEARRAALEADIAQAETAATPQRLHGPYSAPSLSPLRCRRTTLPADHFYGAGHARS